MADGDQQERAGSDPLLLGDVYPDHGRFEAIAEFDCDAVIIQCDGVVEYANQSAARMFAAAEPAVLVGMNSLELVHPARRDQALQRRERVRSDGQRSTSVATRHLRLNGRDFYSETSVGPISWDGRRGTIIVVRDITARSEAEEALRESEKKFSDVVDASSSWLWEADSDLRIKWISEGGRVLLGEGSELLVGANLERMGLRSQGSEQWWRHVEDLQKRRPVRHFVVRWERPNGDVSYLRLTGKPVFDRDGRFKGYRGIGQDVTALFEARKLREDLRDAFEHVPESFALFDADDRFVACNGEFRESSGLSADDLVPGMTFEAMLRRRVELGVLEHEFGDTPPEEWIAERIARHQNPGSPLKVRIGDRWRQITETRLPNGGTTLTGVDITDLVSSDGELRESRMLEAVGPLTSGIVHDFNNILAIILGNIELVLEGAPLGSEHRSMLQRAAKSAARGGALTHRLLAFSRRQMLKPESVDLAALVSRMTDKLHHSLGHGIEVTMQFADDLWNGHIDSVQLQSALLSLIINARESMPNGGRISISGTNRILSDRNEGDYGFMPPGDYVCLTVTDNGNGMPPDVVEHAFDPFFTTKEIGEGTGLGLSAAFGFMRQSGGRALIRSKEGSGTTVELVIPRSAAQSLQDQRVLTRPLGQELRAVNVLVVEDDDYVRVQMVSQLQVMGYMTAAAATGTAAMALVDGPVEFDLIIADIGLADGPGGPELAREARRRNPDLAVVLMSDNFEPDPADSVAAAERLAKPFRMSQLEAIARQALERRLPRQV